MRGFGQSQINLNSVVLLVDGAEDSIAPNLTSDIYQGLWQAPSIGSFELQLIALDQAGNSIAKSDVVNIAVGDSYNWSGGLPGVSILHPQTNDFLTTSSSIHLTASASDVDFDLKEVQFYVNGQVWGDPLQHLSVDMPIFIPILSDGNQQPQGSI